MFFQVFSGVFACVADTCFKCFICLLLHVASVASGCLKSRLGVAHAMCVGSGRGASGPRAWSDGAGDVGGGAGQGHSLARCVGSHRPTLVPRIGRPGAIASPKIKLPL